VFQAHRARLTSTLRTSHRLGRKIRAGPRERTLAMMLPLVGRRLPSALAEASCCGASSGLGAGIRILACSVNWDPAMGRRSRRGGDADRRSARIAAGVVLAVLILVSWLSFDWLLATPRTTLVVAQLPRTDGKPDQRDRTPGHPVEVGSNSVTGVASGATRRDSVAGAGDRGGPSSDRPGSYSSSAGPRASTGLDSITSIDSTGGESSGPPGWSAAGSPGSGTGSNGSPAPVVAGLPPNAGATPRGSGPGGAPGSGPGSDGSSALSPASGGDGPGLPGGAVPLTILAGGSTPPDGTMVSGASGGDGQAPPRGPAPPTVPTSGSAPLDPGQSKPPGAGDDNSGPFATVPVPPGLLLFGASASMLGVLSRMRRRSPRSRYEPPLTR